MTLAPETRVILNLLNQFDALTIEQIKRIFKGTKFNPKPMIAYLCNNRTIKFLDNNYAMLQNISTYKPETLYSVWVMLDRIKAERISDSLDLSSARNGSDDNGTDIVYINNGKLIEYITFIDEMTLTKVSYIQDTFYTSTGVKPGQEEKSNRLYTFVIKDLSILETLSEMQLTIPFMVAYIEGDLEGIPSIEYYQMA